MAAAGRFGIGALTILVLGLTGLPDRAARAQMVLPGAVAPSPAGASQAPASTSRPRPKAPGSGEPVVRGTSVPIPSVLSLVGKTLALDGAASQIVFGVAAQTVAVARLTLSGEKISKSQDACRVDTGTAPLPLSGLGKPDGLQRYRIEFPACPIVFDVLEGAILADPSHGTCDFVEADCRVKQGGLWGLSAAEIGPDRVKALERARAAAESAVRSNYKALTASTKDRPTIMGFARDQAQFSSSREETCRDYAEEGRHNYCATKVTEARAALLHDRLGTALVEKAARKAKQHGKK